MSYLKKEFGKNLRLLRKIRNLTQEQLAEKLDLSHRQLTRIENGNSFVSAEVLEKLIIALNVEIKDLFNFSLKELVINAQHNTVSSFQEKNYKNIEIIITKLKKIQKNEKHWNYINLAFDSLTNKEARIKLKTLIEGMELVY